MACRKPKTRERRSFLSVPQSCRSGEHHGSILDSYRKATSIIEASDLDYTILRPAWLNNRDEIAYGTTQKGEPFKNASGVVSRKSVADLVVKLAMTPGLESRHSLGVHREL